MPQIHPISLKERISQYRIKDVDGNNLSNDEASSVLCFIDELVKHKGKHIIYRGESLKNLKSQFRGEYLNENQLAHYIFIMGEKARACWDLEPKLIAGITTEENFRLILEKLRDALLSHTYGGFHKSLAMDNFKQRNYLFVDHVINNSTEILLAYDRLSNDEKEAVNIFYISLLHTINWRAFGRCSTFVSTTSRFSVAQKFAKDFIFIGWYPTSGNFYHNGGRIINDYVSGDYHGVPLCSPAFPRQSEISIRCGILPHFMLGYIVKASNELVVNPGIMQTWEEGRTKDDFIENGLTIDQTDFLDYCSHTNLRYYFTVRDGHYELHII